MDDEVRAYERGGKQMSNGEDYAFMIDAIRHINQDIDILRLKLTTLSNYTNVGDRRDEIKSISHSLATVSQICRGCYVDLIRLEMEDREDFLNGNSK